MSSSFISFDLVGATVDAASSAAARAARERAELDAARSRWRRLAARLEIHAHQCASVGAPELVVSVNGIPPGDARDVDAACAAVESRLSDAAARVAALLQQRRRAEVDAGLSAALADLARRESAAVATGSAPAAPGQATRSADSAADAAARGARVEQLLASLLEGDPALVAAGAEILRTTDPARARLLLSDLSRRVRTANLATEAMRATTAAIAELRADTADLADPTPVSVLLDHAESAASPGTAAALLDRATALAERARAAERPRPELAFVLESVTAAFTDLGYTVDPVTVVAPGSVLVNRPGATQHAVLAQVEGDEISLRTVRTSSGTRPDDDRAQDSALCGDIDRIATRLRARGVTPGRIRRAPAGITALPVIPRTDPSTATPKAKHVRRTSGTERSAE
ncbi:hypothetical protein [Nocardia caishijiensis]|uniref:Flagellar hook-length control protein FliK n=1 Tax=Nocardia caishijiensis TaxID=184756 RepID=A0ABQ6YHL7_9NOCA|nr:hypothetical protein [Nocardia caishijiensis]KAF0845279.1 hypothetical protein FNL39_10887 [Nocardia caishijiensis]